jgi:tRNA dimethylallyltransferase
MSRIVVVCGPTASGKSRLAAELALRFSGEVINADSMQVYRGMDIACAMPTEAEKMGVKHHLFGIIEASQPFSVVDWLELARGKIAEIESRSALPVIAGGTGLYIASLVDNIIFDETGGDFAFREEMYSLAKARGNAFVLGKLREVDPGAASALHENNLKRVIRALETFKMSKISLAQRTERSRAECSPYEVCVFGIDFRDRQALYNRINDRVDLMISNGLIDEAKRYYAANPSVNPERITSSQAIGHKELLPFITGNGDLDSCIDNLKRKTRNYAKRQLTWFRKDKRIHWLFPDERESSGFDSILEKATVILKNNKFY